MIRILKVIHYFRMMFSETLEKCALKCVYIDPLIFLSAPGLAWQTAIKKTKVKLELLTDIDMILMMEKGIRRGISHRYSNANDRYMKDYDKNKKSSYL